MIVKNLINKIQPLKSEKISQIKQICRFSTNNQDNSNNKEQQKQAKKQEYKENLSVLQHELLNNPYFDQAHPQFQNKKPKTYIKKESENLDFIESLTMQQRVPQHLTQEEQEQYNYKYYLEGYKSPQGPLKWMKQEQKDEIHTLIDDKLQSLEDSELSREEILYEDGRKGLPLSQDPFFQFIKNNRIAREMMLKPGEEFTVKKIVELALRQDVGPDPSQARSKQNLPKFEKLDDQSNLEHSNWNHFNPDQYFSQYSSKTQSYIKEFMKPDRKIHHMPLSEAEKRKRSQRQINYFDIHWRNTELLSEFINAAANIKNHKQNRLSRNQQKRVSKAIRLAREMALLPYVGTIKPSDKQSLKTLQEDLEQRTKMAINIETGHIYVKGQEPTSVEINQRVEEQLGNQQQEDYEINMLADMPEDEVLLQAQAQANNLREQQLLSQGIDPKNLKKSYKDQPSHTTQLTPEAYQQFFPQSYNSYSDQDPILQMSKNTPKEKLESSYQQIKERVMQQSINDFAQLLLAEKSSDSQGFPRQNQDLKSNLSEQESLDFLNQIREMGNLPKINTV